MRQAESDYWDQEAKDRIFDGKNISENVYKRQEIVRLLLESDFIDQRALEIGVGTGVSMAAVRIAIVGRMQYMCTDVSKTFCDFVEKTWAFAACHTDILNLPEIEGGFTRVVCLDSLEHVNPLDRVEGYKEISRVMAEHGKVLINMPVEETQHNLEFDHPFSVQDIRILADTIGGVITRYEPYTTRVARYVWVEVTR